MTELIKYGCCAIDLDEDTSEPVSVVFSIEQSRILLTPSPISAQVLVMVLKRLVECDKENPGQAVSGDRFMFELVRRGLQHGSEFSHIDKLLIEGELCFWICCGALSVYLSLEEAEQIVNDFENCVLRLRSEGAAEVFLISRAKFFRCKGLQVAAGLFFSAEILFL